MALAKTEESHGEKAEQAEPSQALIGGARVAAPARPDTLGASCGLASSGPAILAEADQRYLLKLARLSLISAVNNCGPPVVNRASPEIAKPRGCFITLSKAGELRGCVGQLFPQEPLYQTVSENVRGAAFRDPRFPPIQGDEVSQVTIEISVLTEPQVLHCRSAEELLGRMRPQQDGVLLRVGDGIATFLPQVWDEIPDKTQFLERLAQKAGCRATGWRGEEAEISIYQAQCFAEEGVG